MFETMQSFYAFFFPMLALIILGIIFEDKLIRFEQHIFHLVRRRIEARRAKKRPALRAVKRSNAPRKRRGNVTKFDGRAA